MNIKKLCKLVCIFLISNGTVHASSLLLEEISHKSFQIGRRLISSVAYKPRPISSSFNSIRAEKEHKPYIISIPHKKYVFPTLPSRHFTTGFQSNPRKNFWLIDQRKYFSSLPMQEFKKPATLGEILKFRREQLGINDSNTIEDKYDAYVSNINANTNLDSKVILDPKSTTLEEAADCVRKNCHTTLKSMSDALGINSELTVAYAKKLLELSDALLNSNSAGLKYDRVFVEDVTQSYYGWDLTLLEYYNQAPNVEYLKKTSIHSEIYEKLQIAIFNIDVLGNKLIRKLSSIT